MRPDDLRSVMKDEMMTAGREPALQAGNMAQQSAAVSSLLSELNETIGLLIDRIDPVLLPFDPRTSPEAKSSDDRPAMSVAAGIMDDQATRLRHALSMLNTTIARVDI